MKNEKETELLHDAINFLDDDMISEVEKLRGGAGIEKTPMKVTPIQTHMSWRKWAALAACVCILIGGSYIYRDYILLKDDIQNSETETLQNETAQNSSGVVEDESRTEQKDYENLVDHELLGTGAEGTDGFTEQEFFVKEDIAQAMYEKCEEFLQKIRQSIKDIEEGR